MFLLPNLVLAGSASSGLFQKDKCTRFKGVFGRSVVTALNIWFYFSFSVLEFTGVVIALPVEQTVC